jgi:hypothetical protein
VTASPDTVEDQLVVLAMVERLLATTDDDQAAITDFRALCTGCHDPWLLLLTAVDLAADLLLRVAGDSGRTPEEIIATIRANLLEDLASPF